MYYIYVCVCVIFIVCIDDKKSAINRIQLNLYLCNARTQTLKKTLSVTIGLSLFWSLFWSFEVRMSNYENDSIHTHLTEKKLKVGTRVIYINYS